MTPTDHDIAHEPMLDPTAESRAEPPWKPLRRALRGRWRLVLAASLGLGIVGSVVGHHARPPKYRSNGLVLIEGALSPILYHSEEVRVPPMFEAFVAAQETRLRSRQVLVDALADPAAVAAGWPAGEAGVAALLRGLEVKRGRRESVLTVSMWHRDPAMAATGVNAVLAAFERSVIDPTGLSVTAKMNTLERREAELHEQIRSLRSAINERSDGYGADAVDRMHAERVQELIAIEEQITAFDSDGSGAGWIGSVGAGVAAGGLTSIAVHLAELERRELALAADLSRHTHDYGPSHPMIRRIVAELETVRARIAVCERSLAGFDDTIDGGGPTDTATAARRARLRDRTFARRDALRGDVDRLARQKADIAELAGQAGELTSRLWQTRRRLDELRVEARRDDLNRVSIAAWGDRPVTPVSDRRRALAAVGALFGVCAGIGLVVLLGTVDPRARYVEELEARTDLPPVLGLLPDLGADAVPADPTHAEAATRSVEQLAGLLELRAAPADGSSGACVHCVTSAVRGEGRTSLALALASALASAGRRTVVIDTDADHAGLTRALRLDERPSTDGCLQATGQPGLLAIPFGTDAGLRREELSPARLAALLQDLRQRADVIIVDTGPILASAEACLVAAAADTVITVVDRDQKIKRLRAAFARLEPAGAVSTGLVLNRAAASDLRSRARGSAGADARVAAFVPSAPTDGPAPIALHDTIEHQEETWRRAA
jgi:Mrp family chromosome partitioning ATPase/uncharacterized protein involved in exopolysaccharide biosynthesis